MPQPVQRHIGGSEEAGKLCSICQTNIIAGETVLSCPSCALPFHAECWDENQGCSTYGCVEAPQVAKTEAPVQGLTNAWGGEKVCPSCGRQIKAQAIKCRFCGAGFNSRDVMTEEQYSTREYEGSESVNVRNKLIALFIVSATGCLSFITVFVSGIMIFGNGALGIEYRRLDSAQRALLYASFSVSCVLLLLLGLVIIFD